MGKPKQALEVETTPSISRLILMALQANETKREEREKASGKSATAVPIAPRG